jgi:hypothetical protein
MDRRVILLSLIILGGCAHSDPWTTGDTVLQTVYTASALADGYMTTKIQDHPNIIENGRIAKQFLGPNPSDSDTWMYIGTLIVTNYLIARALPQGWRSIWQVGTTIPHVLAVNSGHQMGLFATPCTRHQEEHPCPIILKKNSDRS